MSSTNKTNTYQLNQWVLDDPLLMADFNADNSRIDSALRGLSGSISNTAASLNSTIETLPFKKIKEITASASASAVSLDVSDLDFSRYSRVDLKVIFSNGQNSISSVRMSPNGLSLTPTNTWYSPRDNNDHHRWYHMRSDDTVGADMTSSLDAGFGSCFYRFSFFVENNFFYIQPDSSWYGNYRCSLGGSLTSIRLSAIACTENWNGSTSSPSWTYSSSFGAFPAGTKFVFYGVKL